MKKDCKYFFKRCRLCGRCYKGSVDIFTPQDKNLKELIERCLNINVNEDDDLPKKLCRFCDKKLSLWQKFKNTCENVQIKLAIDSPKNKDDAKLKKSNDQSDIFCSSIEQSNDKLTERVVKNEGKRFILSCQGTDVLKYGQTEKTREIRGTGLSKKDTSADIKDSKETNVPEQEKNVNSNGVSSESKFSTKLTKYSDKIESDHHMDVSQLPDKDFNDSVSEDGGTGSHQLELKETAKNSEIIANEVPKHPLLTKNTKKKQKRDLKSEEKKEIPMNEYPCVTCGKIFYSSRKMKVHLKCHSNGSNITKKVKRTETDLQCPQCPQKLKNSFNLRNHLETHSKICNYCCHLCGKLFKTHSSLLNHIRLHICDEMENEGKDSVILANGKLVKLFQCHICDKKFRQSGHLTYHMKMHTGERSFSCDCGMRFTKKYQLRNHINAVHSNQKRHTCNVCGKQFFHTHNFKDHMLLHEGIAKISCDLCGKTFLTSGGLSRHRRLHTGEKPFPCDICGKTFRDCSNRKRHRNKHTLEEREASSTKERATQEVSNLLSPAIRNEGALSTDSGSKKTTQDDVIGKQTVVVFEENAEEKTKKIYTDLKTYFESNDDISVRDIEKDNQLVLPMESLVSAVSNHNASVLEPIPTVGNIDDSSNPGPLLGCSLFGEEMDLNSENLLLIGDGRVNNNLLEGGGVESEGMKDQLVWIPSSCSVQGRDDNLNSILNGEASLRSNHGGDVALSAIQTGDIGLASIQVGDIGFNCIQGTDITGILEVGMEYCRDFDVNSTIELESGKHELSDEFSSIGVIKEVDENEKVLENVLCLQEKKPCPRCRQIWYKYSVEELGTTMCLRTHFLNFAPRPMKG